MTDDTPLERSNVGWFAVAVISTTVRQQHPRSHHRGATSMQMHRNTGGSFIYTLYINMYVYI